MLEYFYHHTYSIMKHLQKFILLRKVELKVPFTIKSIVIPPAIGYFACMLVYSFGIDMVLM